MTQIEVKTTGELIYGDNVIGQITFTVPFIESEVAGNYSMDFGIFSPDHSEAFHCELCDEKDEEIDDLEEKITRLDQALKAVIQERDELIETHKAPEAAS